MKSHQSLPIPQLIFLIGITLIPILSIDRLALSDDFPPGWVPVKRLDAEMTWREVRDDQDHIHLYLPKENKPVRGVFVCFVFHSGDPRELADLWNFALVTVPWPFEYDLGVNDKRNGRYKAGHQSQNMGLLLRYLEQAAKDTNHPELKTVPIVGWLGQNGSRLCDDLFQRAPHRVLAWSDSFPNRLRHYPELTQKIPFAFAWEVSKKELRESKRQYKKDNSSPNDLSCRASTYGHGHGIYSKFNFFMMYLDRCIQVRMPKQMPEPGQKVNLLNADRNSGWLGDFDPISGWNPIGPANDPKLKGCRYPVWLPDEYSAWAWRSYHSSCTDLEISGPKVVYRKKDGKWGGPDCGLGYGGFLSKDESHRFAAKVRSTEYVKVHYYDGNQLLGSASKATTDQSWEVKGIALKPGLRVLFAVGEKEDGTRQASRPAMVIVK